MKRLTAFFRRIPPFFSLITGCMLVVILLLLLLGQNAFGHAYQNSSLLSNGVLYPAVLLCIAGFWFLCKRLTRCVNPWMIRILFACVLVVQLLVARTCWYHLGWDPQTVHRTAEEIARGLPVSNTEYFVSCPNNAPLTVLLSIPLWAAVQLNLGVPYVVLPYIDAVILNATAYLCVLCVQHLTSKPAARLYALVLSLGWIGLSPYILYPYTDVYSVFFPVAAFYVYLKCRKPFLKWFLISLLCFAGAAIKPTVLIFLIALILIALCSVFEARRNVRSLICKQFLPVFCALLLGAVPGRAFQTMSTNWLTNDQAGKTHLSVTHYLMLGMNPATYGGHSVEDVEYTMSFETLKDAQTANLQRAWTRFAERGVWGNLHFFAVKAYKAFADGSFASHGSFLGIDVPKRADGLSQFLRRFYHKRGDLLPYCQTIAQGIWLMVLSLCAVAAFLRRKHTAVALLCLTLLGLTAYLLLFEVWPRYLFLYAPFFVVLSSLAFDPHDDAELKP